MERFFHILMPVAAVVLTLFTGCRSSATIDNDWARRASSIEAAVDDSGRLTEIEYHIAPGDVPAAVRDAMMKLYPGGTLTGAEYEVNDGAVYYELTSRVQGREAEAMFLESGELHSMETQIEPQSAPAVTASVARRWPGSTLRTVEEIRNQDQELVEYHVKIDAGGMSLKVIVDVNGNVTHAVREMDAELEVPIPLG